jgi:hypothetical protein
MALILTHISWSAISFIPYRTMTVYMNCILGPVVLLAYVVFIVKHAVFGKSDDLPILGALGLSALTLSLSAVYNLVYLTSIKTFGVNW